MSASNLNGGLLVYAICCNGEILLERFDFLNLAIEAAQERFDSAFTWEIVEILSEVS
jgi:hypothetical protein